MNDDTYTKCTKCGRPMEYCKGQCCGKPRGCNCKEYGPAVCGVIRQRQPECPYTSVIPSITVDNVSNLKDLCDTFVHVADINTTFYIDDKHRTIITWAGPVEYDNYDLATNTLGLRSQFLIDFENHRGAYYDKTGKYEVFNFGGSGADEPIRLTMNYSTDPADWESGGLAPVLDRDRSGRAVFNLTCDQSKVSFTNQSTAETISVSDLVAMLDSGENIVLDNVPLGATIDENTMSPVFNTIVDGVSLPNKTVQTLDASTSITTYSGSAQVMFDGNTLFAATSLGIFIIKASDIGPSVMVQGIRLNPFN